MKKLTSVIAATGIVAGLGVAALPLASYAADPASDTASVTVSLEVSDAISITVDDNESTTINLGTIAPNAITGTGKKVVANVKSNNASGYTVTAAGTALTRASGTETIAYGSVAAGTSAWGISVGTDAGYSALTSIATPTAASAEDGDDYNIFFGASTNASQKTGTYSGTLTLTATNKN